VGLRLLHAHTHRNVAFVVHRLAQLLCIQLQVLAQSLDDSCAENLWAGKGGGAGLCNNGVNIADSGYKSEWYIRC
jgi:hypothetical protein